MAWWQFWKSDVIAADEAWVVTKLHAFVNGVQIVEADLQAAADWIFNHIGSLEADVAALIGIANVTGLAISPEIAGAVTITEKALGALQAYETAHNSGASTASSVVSAYQALKSTQGAYQDIAKALTAPSVPAAPVLAKAA
jgi:hypothetical protein